VVALGACSLAISGPAANRKRLEMPVCDSAKGLVALDALDAVGLSVAGLASLGSDEGVGAIALVGAALFTASAVHGSNTADKCRAEQALYAQEVVESAPPRVGRRSRRQQPVSDDDTDEGEPIRVPMPPRHLAHPEDTTPAEPGQPAPPPPDQEDQAAPPRPPKQPTRSDDWSQFWREVP